MTWRFLHSADLHLDAPLRSLAMVDPDLRVRVATASRDALCRMVDICIDRRLDGLLLAGDVFDRAEQSLNAVAFFAAQMARLHEVGIPAFMIRGNHDHENRASRKIQMPPNVHLFGSASGSVTLDGKGAPMAIHGISYEGIDAAGSLLARYPLPTPGAANIGLLHTSLAGSAAHDSYAPCAPADLAAMDYTYWALGHIHVRSVYREGEVVIVMPGSPQGRHINEPGGRSATLLTVENDRVTKLDEIPTASVVFDRVTVEIDEERGEELDRRCRRVLEAHAHRVLAPGQALVARVEATGSPAALGALRRHAVLWSERAAQAVSDLDGVWIEQLSFAPGEATRPEAGPVAEIAALMRQLRYEPAVRHALDDILQGALDHLPPAEQRAIASLAEDQAALLETLTNEAIEDMVAALSGEGAEA